MTVRNMAYVRDRLLDAMDLVTDPTKEWDYWQIQALQGLAHSVVATQKLKLDYLKLMQGDGSIPFLEESDPNDKSKGGGGEGGSAAPVGPFSLLSGPRPDHPWRGQTVRRLQR